MILLNILFGILQLGFISYILFKEVERKSPAMFLWATLLLMFGVPHLLTALVGDKDYQEETICKASIFVICFCILYILFRSKKKVDFINISRRKGFRIDNDEVAYSIFEMICFAIMVIAVMVLLLSNIRVQGGLLNSSWGGTRKIERSYLTLDGLASRLMHMFSGLSLYYFLTARKNRAFIVLFLQAFVVLVTRNRVLVLPIFIFSILLYIIKMYKIKLKHIIFGAVAAVVIIYIVYAIRAFRWLGSLSNALSEVSWEYLNSMVIRFINDKSGELGLRQWFYYFIEHNNNFDGFNRAYSYIRMALVYIPSQWSLGLKPSSFDICMGQAIGMASGGSMHPTLFGDCFANLYWFGIFLGGFWAAFANFFDKMISRKKNSFHKIMIFFMISYSYVVMGRGSVYNGFETTAWGILFLYLMDLTLKSLKHIKFHFARFGHTSRVGRRRCGQERL